MAKLTYGIGIDPSQLRQLDEALAGLRFKDRPAAQVAMQAAISRTVTTGRTAIARQIAEYVRLRIQDINEVISVSRGNYTDPTGEITITKKPIPLIRYMTSGQRASAVKRVARQGLAARSRLGRIKISTRRQASGPYATQETLPSSKYPNAFLAVVGGGHLGIFQRKGKSRLPIRELMGPTPLGVFENAAGKGGRKLIDDALDNLADVLRKNILSQIDRFTK